MRCQPTAPHALVQAQRALLAADGLQKSPEDRRGALRGTKVVSGYPPKSGAAAPSTRCSGSTALLQAAPDRSGELPHPPADRAHCDRTSPHIRSPLHNQPPLHHPGSRCDIDSHPDCRPFLTLIVAPQACVLAESPKATLSHRSASVQFVTSLDRSDCFRLERQVPGGIRTRWDTAPFHGAR